MPPWAWEAWGSGRSLRSFCGCRPRAGWCAGGAQGQRGDGSVPAALSSWSFGPAGCRSPSEEPLPGRARPTWGAHPVAQRLS